MKISQEKIERAAKIANIHDFIVNELPQQYETIIGENGIRLSGGQRQRIGIARALYFKPKLLVLDEATSALDDQTERKVIEEINNFSKEITIISIAHRLSTLEQCDTIFLIKNGFLKNSRES
jgi:ABC-type multidrug transport system fused ATPase/permease subunit